MALSTAAAPSGVETAVREGRPAEALRLLEDGSDTLPPAESAFWKGQALARLGRTEEAAEAFCQVPQGHALYPFAAKGILYCAWQSPFIHFVEVCAPLTASPDTEIAALAQAALAEHQLRYTKQGDDSAFTHLEQLASERADLRPLVKLLGIHTRLREGDVEGGIEYARLLEHDPELSLIMRQRVRLELAELYYAKEEAGLTQSEAGEESDEGKGEETLLQFITANPDSPLLEEAFRRLHRHGAVGGSEYTRDKLLEWADDTTHPRRASLALLARQQEQATNGAAAASIANRAVSELPGEPATRSILLEQIRQLYGQNKPEEARQYLAMLGNAQGGKGDDARTQFFHALQLWAQPAEALPAFLQCAQSADAALLTPALTNSLICAMRTGNEEATQALLSAAGSVRTRRALLLAHAGFEPEKAPERALQELNEVMSLNPTPEQAVDVLLERAYISLASQPQEALQSLLACNEDARSHWTLAQLLRYAALLEHAADLLQQAGAADAPQAADILYRLYSESQNLNSKAAIALHLADRFSAEGRHKQAVELLLDLAQRQSTGPAKAATLLYAAQESSQLGTLAALEHAVRLFAECARQGGELTSVATIAQAGILVRINRTAEAFDLLHRLQQAMPNLPVGEQAYALTIQADAYGMSRTPEGNAAAIATCEKILALPGLSHAWQMRSRLQHAALCSRSHKHTEALADYRHVMELEGATPPSQPDHKNSFLYYYAGAGAVYQLLRLERYSDAAALAAEVAAWPGSPTAPAAQPGPKSESFARWAQSIRQSHYLPGTGLK